MILLYPEGKNRRSAMLDYIQNLTELKFTRDEDIKAEEIVYSIKGNKIDFNYILLTRDEYIQRAKDEVTKVIVDINKYTDNNSASVSALLLSAVTDMSTVKEFTNPEFISDIHKVITVHYPAVLDHVLDVVSVHANKRYDDILREESNMNNELKHLNEQMQRVVSHSFVLRNLGKTMFKKVLVDMPIISRDGIRLNTTITEFFREPVRSDTRLSNSTVLCLPVQELYSNTEAIKDTIDKLFNKLSLVHTKASYKIMLTRYEDVVKEYLGGMLVNPIKTDGVNIGLIECAYDYKSNSIQSVLSGFDRSLSDVKAYAARALRVAPSNIIVSDDILEVMQTNPIKVSDIYKEIDIKIKEDELEKATREIVRLYNKERVRTLASICDLSFLSKSTIKDILTWRYDGKERFRVFKESSTLPGIVYNLGMSESLTKEAMLLLSKAITAGAKIDDKSKVEDYRSLLEIFKHAYISKIEDLVLGTNMSIPDPRDSMDANDTRKEDALKVAEKLVDKRITLEEFEELSKKSKEVYRRVINFVRMSYFEYTKEFIKSEESININVEDMVKTAVAKKNEIITIYINNKDWW